MVMCAHNSKNNEGCYTQRKANIQLKKNPQSGRLMPVILAARETEIGRIMVQGQPRQILAKTPSPK
jgi:hypothetical protein